MVSPATKKADLGGIDTPPSANYLVVHNPAKCSVFWRSTQGHGEISFPFGNPPPHPLFSLRSQTATSQLAGFRNNNNNKQRRQRQQQEQQRRRRRRGRRRRRPRRRRRQRYQQPPLLWSRALWLRLSVRRLTRLWLRCASQGSQPPPLGRMLPGCPKSRSPSCTGRGCSGPHRLSSLSW